MKISLQSRGPSANNRAACAHLLQAHPLLTLPLTYCIKGVFCSIPHKDAIDTNNDKLTPVVDLLLRVLSLHNKHTDWDGFLLTLLFYFGYRRSHGFTCHFS